MLGAERLRDQHGPVRFQSGGVGDQLAQVVVVGGFKQVLDDESMTGVRIPEHDISRERPDRDLVAFQLQIHLERLAEVARVRRQPRREISGLVRPHLTQRHIFKRRNINHRTRPLRRPGPEP